MGAILKQLLGKAGIPEHIREAYRKGKTEVGGRRLLLPDLMGMLKSTIALLPQTFICIDALDECLPRHLPVLLKSLRDIARESPTTRIFLTGRPHVGDDIQRCFPRAVGIPISPNADDIRNYLEMRLDSDTEPDAMNDELRADIMRIIPEKISDIFLLITVHQRRKKLEEMTQGNGLSDAYTATLNRVKAQKGTKSILGMKVLRQLQADELCRAMGVEIGSTDFDLENASSSTYLSGDPTLFSSPHSSIAEVCLTYLNSQSPSTIPLLEYASCQLLDGFEEHISAQLGWNIPYDPVGRVTGFTGLHGAIVVAVLRVKEWDLNAIDSTGTTRGYEDVVKLLLTREDINPNTPDTKYGQTPLCWAARNGHEAVVKTLLAREDVNPNTPDTECGQTPLCWAARNRHEAVIKTLLAREDVNPNTPNPRSGQTPLCSAARWGHEAVVKTLLAREDVNPNTPDNSTGSTALIWAARLGHGGAVKTLLAREDVNPNTPDTKYPEHRSIGRLATAMRRY
ncbi:ankyrin [Choiromyces venosus 120613-1]|uniref:Ankyrin n=1 Tax=Choiromyces venosus 120613-1 TaxID=1336337 RepID=A0A3N4J4C4_9PEZI|nr:ankyrin [Choiromyces venosus 120613-1]